MPTYKAGGLAKLKPTLLKLEGWITKASGFDGICTNILGRIDALNKILDGDGRLVDEDGYQHLVALRDALVVASFDTATPWVDSTPG